MAEDTGLLSSNVSAGDDGLASQYNNLRADTKKMRQEEMTAGATIAGATLPVPVYQNTSDNEVYACDADDTDKLNFFGFAISDETDGNAIIVQHTGIVGGFTGLDEGEKYYVQDTAGTIGKTPGEHKILVGIAISATELLIMKEDAPWDDWTEQSMAFDHDNITSDLVRYDFCFSDDRKYLFFIFYISSASIRVQRYKRNGSNGKYYWENVTAVVDSGASVEGCGITYHNGYVYCLYNDSSGVQAIKRYNTDFTGGSLQTISGGNNNEQWGLTNNGTDFYTINNSANLGAKYTLSGTTFTRDSTIVFTGMSNGGGYTNCLTNDGTNLIFMMNSAFGDYSWADLSTQRIYGVIFAGGALTTYTQVDKVAQAGYNYILGLIPYGDNDSDRFVVLRMLPVVNGASPTNMETWYSLSLSIIDKSAL